MDKYTEITITIKGMDENVSKKLIKVLIELMQICGFSDFSIMSSEISEKSLIEEVENG